MDEPKERLTIAKAESLVRDEAFEVSGYVLLNSETGARRIVELGAVRALENDQMWKLMHPPQSHLITVPANYTPGEPERVVALEPCPFCGAGEFFFRALGRMWTGQRLSDPVSIELIHHCPKIEGQPTRAIVRAGRDVQGAVDMWNLRS